MLQISPDPPDSTGDSCPARPDSGAYDPVMGALVEMWEGPVGILCQTGPGFLRLKGALIGKVAWHGEHGGTGPGWWDVSLLTCTTAVDPLLIKDERKNVLFVECFFFWCRFWFWNSDIFSLVLKGFGRYCTTFAAIHTVFSCIGKTKRSMLKCCKCILLLTRWIHKAMKISRRDQAKVQKLH